MKKRVVLKASAGTGKTYRLSLEYIATLNSRIDYRDILVITFTKKATGEIKNRVFKFLNEICEDENKKNEIEENLKRIYGEGFLLDIPYLKKVNNEILLNKDKVKIYTIDGFFNLIFRKIVAPYLKIYSYEIISKKEDEEKYLTKTFEKLFENKELFSKFKFFLLDNAERKMETYISLIKDIINDSWKISLIRGVNPIKSFNVTIDDAFELLSKLEKTFLEIAEKRNKSLDKLVKNSGMNYFTAENRIEFLNENWETLAKDVIWKKTAIKDSDEYYDILQHLFDEFVDTISKVKFNEVIIPYEKKLLPVMEEIIKIHYDIKIKEKKFNHTDISYLLFQYLSNPEINFFDKDGLNSDFYEIMESNFDAIFIDEFQDTSIIQWKILKNIVDKAKIVICVGDEKQSIYGWRGGEKKLFENLPQIIEGSEERLSTCYRSKENIIRYTNDIFDLISSETKNEVDINTHWNFEKVEFIEKKEKGEVEVFITENPAEDIALKILEHFEGNYSGVGILARKTKQLYEIGEILKKYNIPFTLNAEINLLESSGIRGFYYFIKFLVYRDFFSLLEFLRSEIINISSSELQFFIKNRDFIENYLYSDENSEMIIQINFENIPTLSKNIIFTIKTIIKKYKASLQEYKKINYELIETLGIKSILTKEEDLLNLFSFYEILSEYDSILEFLADFERNKENNTFNKNIFSQQNSVQLMTIHKSKGLEFDTVFYYAKDGGKKGFFGYSNKVYLEFDSSFTQVKSFLVTNTKLKNILKYINEINFLKNDEIKEAQEEINNCYVALTRAANNLFIFYEGKNCNLIPKDEKIYKDFIITKIRNENNEEVEELDLELSFCEKSEIPELTQEEREELLKKIDNHTIEIELRRIKGNIIHYFLENINEWTEENIAFSKNITLSKYSGILKEDELKEIFSEKNIELIYSKCEDIFNTNWDYVHNELPIFYEGEQYRIDKLLIKKPSQNSKGIALIVDYKTGKIDVEQLENYKKIISSILDSNNYEIIGKFIEL